MKFLVDFEAVHQKSLSWIYRATEPDITEQDLVKKLAPKSESVLDLGCGLGRYAHVLKYDKYTGYTPWPQEVKAAQEWAERDDLEEVTFKKKDPFTKWTGVKPDLVLSINLIRHLEDPIAGYQFIWDALPEGAYWITDFLTHSGDGVVYDGQFSSLVSEKIMNDFLAGKKHTNPNKWFNFVGDWWLVRLQK